MPASTKRINKLKIVPVIFLVTQIAGTINAAPAFPKLTPREFSVGSYVESVGFSPDGNYVLTGSTHGVMTLWDAVTGKAVRTFRGDPGFVWRVAFSPDGKQVLIVSGRTVQVWNIDGGHVSTLHYGFSQLALDAAFSPDGKSVVAVGADQIALVWETTNARQIITISNPPLPDQRSGMTGAMMSVAFAPDGKSILIGSDDHTARLWDVKTGSLLRTLTLTDEVRSVAFSSDGKYILTGSFDSMAQLWDTNTGTSVRTFSGHTGKVLSAVFSPDDKYILTGSQDRTAMLWDAQTGAVLQTFLGQRGQVDAVTFSPDGNYVLTGSDDGVARLFVVDTAASTRPRSMVTTLPTARDLNRYQSMNAETGFRQPSQPGTEYATVVVKASQTRLWLNGWCASDSATAQANWKLITQRFLIDGKEVPASQLLQSASTRSDGSSCVSQYTLLSGWRAGESYTIATEQTFAAPIKDGSKTYPAGKYTYVLYVTVV